MPAKGFNVALETIFNKLTPSYVFRARITWKIREQLGSLFALPNRWTCWSLDQRFSTGVSQNLRVLQNVPKGSVRTSEIS